MKISPNKKYRISVNVGWQNVMDNNSQRTQIFFVIHVDCRMCMTTIGGYMKNVHTS